MRRSAATILTTLLFLLLPGLAQASPWYDPDPSDDSVGLVTRIFGSVVDAVLPGAGGTMPQVDLGPMFMVFNAAVMAFGALLVTYGMVVGTMQTAHDGEVLGKRWSSVWVPIRSAAGMGAVIPLASGFSVIQMIVIWFALQGVGVANLVWDRAVSSLGSNASLVGSIQAPDVTPVASGMLKAMACAKAMNAQFTAAGLSTKIEAITIPAYIAGNGGTITGVSWGDPTGQYSRALCGSVTWKTGSQDESTLQAAITGSQTIALHALVVALDPIASKLAAGDPNVPKDTFRTAVESYRSTLLQTAQTALSNTANPAAQEFVTEARAGGWLHAGEYYMVMARINSQAKSAMNDVPQPVLADVLSDLPTEMQPEMQFTMGRVDSYLAKASQPNDQQAQPGAKESGNAVEKALAKIGHAISGTLALLRGDPTRLAGDNPVLVAKSLGDGLMDAGGTAGLIVMAAAGAGGAVPLVGGAAGAVSSMIGPMVSTILLGLASLGALLSVWLPMMPYVLWVAAIAGWLVFLLEAVIAAPLWAVMHAKQDGEGLAGSNIQGYMLLLSLIMRPTLMVFGFISAVLLVSVLGAFVNSSFGAAFSGAEAGGGWFGGIFGPLGAVVVYVALIMAITWKGFGLIHVIPDRILRWVGGGDEGLGEEGIGHQAQHGHTTAMAVMSGAGHRGADAATTTRGGGQRGARERGSAPGKGTDEVHVAEDRRQ